MLLKYKKFLYLTFFLASVANAQSYLPVEEDKNIKVITPDLTQNYVYEYSKVKLLKSRYSDFRDQHIKWLKEYNTEVLLQILKKHVGLPSNVSKSDNSESEALESLGKYIDALSIASVYDPDLKIRLDKLIGSLAEIQTKKIDFNLSLGKGNNVPAFYSLMKGLLNVYAYNQNKVALELHLQILEQFLKGKPSLSQEYTATLDLLLLHTYLFTGNSFYLTHLSNTNFEGSSLKNNEILLLAYIKNAQWVDGDIMPEEVEKWYSELLNVRPLLETNDIKVNLWMDLVQNFHALYPKSSGMDFYENVLLNSLINTKRLVSKAELNQKVFSGNNNITSINSSALNFISTIYSKGLDGSFFVNLFIPSEVNYNGFRIRQTGDLPTSNRVEFSIEASRPKYAIFKFRKPEWAKNVYVSINGVKQRDFPEEEGYIIIHRQWKGVERVSINLDSDFIFKNLEDNRKQVFYGPLALVPDGGTNNVSNDPIVFVTEEKDPNKLMRRVTPTMLMFESINNSTFPKRINFKPLNEVTGDVYQKDIEMYSPIEWAKKR